MNTDNRYDMVTLNLEHCVSDLAEATNMLAVTHWSTEDYIKAAVESTSGRGVRSRIDALVLSTERIKDSQGRVVNSDYAISRLRIALENLTVNIVMEIENFGLWHGQPGEHRWTFESVIGRGTIVLGLKEQDYAPQISQTQMDWPGDTETGIASPRGLGGSRPGF